ncbi:hypothetical protein [Runella slithyformis]|uniref:DUF4595 domain-containing protein n=1 Tax=Runella slithyformis (strain ATCC 29530 / DSM 19594 / LMG 11500 / NCIMB 11436 / LSU 4) TaxID=761193 RepID=A0A7U3ZM42_RUNSL|nr:hypothetical protein [Runella slithyformis]AEI49737.1 hypothetical protein Runsl_3371 [Runella slithyformis DSM 19594]
MNHKFTIYWGIILLSAGFVTFKGCRPKGNEISPTVDSTALSTCVLLSERINNVLYRTYEYDSTRTLVRMVEYSANTSANRVVKRYTFEYTKDKSLIRLRETNLETRDQNYIYEAAYSNTKILNKIYTFRVFNSGAVAQDTLKLVYTQDNQRVAELQSAKGITSRWEYDTASNVKKWMIRVPGKTKDSLVAEYGDHDDKVNIYAFSKGMQVLNLLNGRAHSRRNPLNFTLLKESTDITYQYNDKRVPTLRTLKTKSNNNVLRETVYSYELSCK